MHCLCTPLRNNCAAGKYVDASSDPDDVVNDLEAQLQHISGLGEALGLFNQYLGLFDAATDDLSTLMMAEKEANGRYQLWRSVRDFLEQSRAWTEEPILDDDGLVLLNVEAVRQEVEDYAAKAYQAAKANKDDQVVARLKDVVDDFKELLPLVEELGNPALQARHWDEIFDIIGADIGTGEDGTGFPPFSIRQLLQFDLLEQLDKLQVVGAAASKEAGLEKALAKMHSDWDGVAFRVVEYKDTGTFVVGGTDEVQMLLDDQVVKTQAMRASPFIKPLEAAALSWEKLLLAAQELLDNWLTCQSTWQYLEPIFSSPDILKQMPEEGGKFTQVDTTWRDLMEAAHATPSVLALAKDPERLAGLEEANKLLEEIQKGLATYLELKRLAFPRFFFLSNDEMLEILSETKDPTRVQPHLKKCFEGIDKLQSQRAVEKWLVQVEAGMIQSVQEVCRQGIAAYAATPRAAWVLQWPGQVVLAVSAIYWTQEVAAAMAGGDVQVAGAGSGMGALAGVAARCTAQLGEVVELVRGELSNLSRATLSALVVMDVHARDVVAQLAAEGIEGQPQHFSWLSQLRMYWEEPEKGTENEGRTIVAEYGYEYLGNSSRLVVTPLTDRCYRTLIGAVHLHMGGAPEGPAGTGKTETTKDLAKALARQCVVFNCSDTLDCVTMAKFFKGLASSGAWACFDEFNRIDLEVLSVVAQQVMEIQLAVKAKLRTFTFEGSELRLRPSCNVFITMNPGYAGRSELPDNLKALFRTVAMMVPDYAMIAEIMLFSSGYMKARECARKIVATYKLCSEQLSSQDHYDYGMRAVMAVLRAAGNLKRKFPADDEFVLMLRSIIDVNLCKFLSHDVPLFNGIVSDLFPDVQLPPPDYDLLTAALKRQCAAHNLQATDYFLVKATQLYEMVVVRHGLMLVGQPFSGKSCALTVLAGALGDLADAGVKGPLFNRVQKVVINPKAVTMGQLYGESDKATQEWQDGVLAVAFRSLAADPSPNRKWLVLDGPVDAIWIENMNTVLDDNRKLCLPNSEIIAIPATVSRCGMVYLEPASLGWRPLLASWLAALPKALGPKAKRHLEVLFDWALPACLRFVRRELEELSPSEDAALARGAMRIIESCLDDFVQAPAVAEGGEAPQPPGSALDEAAKARHLEGLFLFALVWSTGATCDSAGRVRFDSFFRVLAAGGVPEGYADSLPAKVPILTVQPIPDSLPAGGGLAPQSVYDYKFDRGSCSWVPWMDTMPALAIPPGAGFSDIMVPTKDSARYTYLLDLAIQHRQPLLMVGPSGTGKTCIIAAHLLSGKGLPEELWMPVAVTLSARTSASMLQEQVDSSLDKRKKGVYGPAIGKRCVVFVDDLNMPAKEVYGAQPPLELLRQARDHEGWYGRDNQFRQMVDVQFVAAMGPPGGGRAFVTNRLLRHFSTLACAQLLPTPAKSHYLFNLRDFARVVQVGQAQAAAEAEGAASAAAFKLLWYLFLQGVMMLPATSLPKDNPATPSAPSAAAAGYKRLWVHEVLRVFYDRLVDSTDRSWLLEQLRGIVSQHLGVQLDQLMAHLLQPDQTEVGQEQLRRCFFGDYMDKGEPRNRQYAEIPDAPAALAAVEEALGDHNAASKRPMPLAMFLLMKQPGGHMLLVGVGGSGRQSLARLAAYMAGLEVFQVEISKSYSRTEWREDLKRLLRRAGCDAKHVMFLFSDSQIKDEAFVEDINNILNAGEVPNMFPADEKMQILEAVQPAAARQGLESPVQMWGYFVSQCKRHLHVVLCMSPIGNAFRSGAFTCQSFLVNCCTCDWFSEWPADALEAVAMKQLKEMDLDGRTRESLVGLCQAMHVQVQSASERFLAEMGRHNYVTPTSYLELLSAYKALLECKKAANSAATKRYNVGLEKLAGSAAQVAGMQQELVAMQPQLVATVAEVEELMARIAHDKKVVVEPKAAVVREGEARAQDKAAAAKAIKDECEADLAEAIPILNDALAALDTIKESDIAYIKKLQNPPPAIKLVLEAVCVVLDVKPGKGKDESGKPVTDYWKPSLGLLAEKDMIGKLKSYDKDNIPPKVMAAIRSTYLTDEGFTPENAKRASPAAEGLCKWVHAMSSYDKVAKVVAPKKAKLAEAEASYREVMVGLTAKRAELQSLLDKLAAMEAELKGQQRKKEQMESDIELCSVKLERAGKLIGGLGVEQARWEETALQLAKAQVNLTGDMLIAAGAVAYLGTFTSAFRQQLVDSFVQLCSKAAGRRWPLLIDPQGQANKWIKCLERDNRLQVIKPSEGGEFMRVLENAVQFGSPVLLEGVGAELDPALEPLLLKQVFKSGGVSCIKLGDTVVEYSPDFRLYITTRLRNPHYLPEVSVKLLGVVVAAERPDLEEQKAALVLAGAENKRQLKEIEDKILEVLSTSTGNILEDESAIAVITEAKRLGNDIAAKQKQGEVTEAAIDEARVAYAPCGEYLSTLFFCISDLAAIDPMYQYSLPWFTKLVLNSLAQAAKAEAVPERLEAIHGHFTASMFRNVCRSLFEKDKLLFAFLLAGRILGSHMQLDGEEWLFLLTGGLGSFKPRPNPAAAWLPDSSWQQLLRLSALPAFAGLAEAVAADPQAWQAVYDAAEPHRDRLPGIYNSLGDLGSCWWCLRPDKVVPAFVESSAADLAACYADSSATTPLIFVLSPGSDPTAALLQFAAEKGMSSRLSAISLGQGQGRKAAALIAEAQAVGSWVVLQNCHLAPSWMPALDRICEEMNPETTHPDFRLWMTSFPSPKFPVNILQSGVKITNEPPAGLRANMRRSLGIEPLANAAFFEGCQQPLPFKRLLFGLVFFHALVQERRKYGPLGWNIPYGFDDGDLRMSAMQLKMFLDEAAPQAAAAAAGDCRASSSMASALPPISASSSSPVPFDALRYTAGECNYGGRVTDDKDRLLLSTILSTCYCQDLVNLGGRYSFSASGTYHPPEDGPREIYLAHIDALPVLQAPEAFGLHANAAITKDINDTQLMLGSLLAMSGGGGTGGGSAAEAAAVEARVAGLIQECLEKLPAPFDLEAVGAKFPVSYGQSLNTLCGVIRDSLRSMAAALKGLLVMSSELEAAYRSISLNQVPELWRAASYPSLRPLGSYLADLYKRLDMLAGWAAAGQPPAVFWLPGFFFLQSFLTAGLQNYARQRSIPIDMVGYDFEMLGMDSAKYQHSPPTEGLYIDGLYLEGAGWDAAARQLCESDPKVLFLPAPVMWFRPKHVEQCTTHQHYNCPMYRTADRRGVLATTGHSTNFVMFVHLPSQQAPQHWTLRGVALLTQLSS
ncbi:dynein heavy chain 8 [Scenedesmus sp. NREL 46B-D3]|nr:dynein heavy chain 8 [Scenedesmus sp. NREL 46B-D3]